MFYFCCFVYSALVARALIENSNLIKWSLLFKALSGLFALICGNGYIVGINQIYDIGIDKYAAHIFTNRSVTCTNILETNSSTASELKGSENITGLLMPFYVV